MATSDKAKTTFVTKDANFY